MKFYTIVFATLMAVVAATPAAPLDDRDLDARACSCPKGYNCCPCGGGIGCKKPGGLCFVSCPNQYCTPSLAWG